MTFRPAPPRSPIASPVAALSRRGFLGATLATGAIGVLGACGLQQDEPKAQAPTSFPPIEEESGKLRVMDFAGTDDENLWSPYGNYPKPDWTFTTGDVDVLAKVRAGATADVACPPVPTVVPTPGPTSGMCVPVCAPTVTPTPTPAPCPTAEPCSTLQSCPTPQPCVTPTPVITPLASPPPPSPTPTPCPTICS